MSNLSVACANQNTCLLCALGANFASTTPNIPTLSLLAAAVLAAMCIQEMFALQRPPAECMRSWDDSHNMARSRSWRTLRYAYLLLMVLAFSLEISTIFVSTQVSTQLATSTWSPNTRFLSNLSLVDFLVSEFELEYSIVRGHFLTGLLSFTIAQSLRVRYALRKYRSLAISGMCCLLTAASGMVCYQVRFLDLFVCVRCYVSALCFRFKAAKLIPLPTSMTQ